MASMNEKINSLLQFVQELQWSQAENQEEMARRLDQLESEVTSNQDKVMQQVVKCMRKERMPEFKKKGHEKQLNSLKT